MLETVRQVCLPNRRENRRVDALRPTKRLLLLWAAIMLLLLHGRWRGPGQRHPLHLLVAGPGGPRPLGAIRGPLLLRPLRVARRKHKLLVSRVASGRGQGTVVARARQPAAGNAWVHQLHSAQRLHSAWLAAHSPSKAWRMS
jgi:hypothetical protein